MFEIDFERHNEEVLQVWEAYWKGNPIRVPFGNLTIGPRIWILDPQLNTDGITWEEFSNNPELMFQVLLEYKHHLVHHVPHDIEMGIPKGHWEIFTEFVNIYDATWLGCPIHYAEGQVSATRPRYTGDRKHEIFDCGMPGPFDGFMSKVKEYYEFFVDRATGYEFHGRPVKVLPPCALGTDGLLTVAFDIRGDEILSDMYLDSDYYHQLMGFVTEALIKRIKAWRNYLGMDRKPRSGYIADDIIQLISVETYREFVLPYHKKYLEELFGSGPHSMHLCGDVQRHFPTLIRELNINLFDTGYPIRFDTLRSEVGEETHIQGGVPVAELLHGTPESIRRRAREILQSGIMRGGKFIMKEANNVPPCLPAKNFSALYEAVKSDRIYHR